MRVKDEMERRETYIELADNLNRLEVAITKGFIESTSSHSSTKKELEILAKQYEKITHAVYGNGKEGLVTVVAKIHQRLSILWAAVWCAGLGLFGVLGYLLQSLAERI